MAEQTKQILVGDVPVGGGAPVSIQTMAKAPPDQVDRIVEQLKDAKKAG
ncbi:MAG: 4-hydroxy-3-methylbut-2-en-1-yl diphosphate synthase, partial [Deltaproteobacteria bacterium]|nr:4-hydroxy-3-methylbut-2-en-1-yl diphosphate synthase [Deltaproteobacteria bacterium]